VLTEDAKPYDWELEALRSRHYSRCTDETYLPWIRRFLAFHGGTHPRELAESDVGENVTASTMRAAIRPDALAGKNPKCAVGAGRDHMPTLSSGTHHRRLGSGHIVPYSATRGEKSMSRQALDELKRLLTNPASPAGRPKQELGLT
jgi:hypothetical protein